MVKLSSSSTGLCCLVVASVAAAGTTASERALASADLAPVFGVNHFNVAESSTPSAKTFWWDFAHPNAVKTATTAEAKCDCIPGYHDALDITCHVAPGGHIDRTPTDCIPGSHADRTCTTLVTCSATQYESSEETPTADRVCSDHAVCTDPTDDNMSMQDVT